MACTWWPAYRWQRTSVTHLASVPSLCLDSPSPREAESATHYRSKVLKTHVPSTLCTGGTGPGQALQTRPRSVPQDVHRQGQHRSHFGTWQWKGQLHPVRGSFTGSSSHGDHTSCPAMVVQAAGCLPVPTGGSSGLCTRPLFACILRLCSSSVFSDSSSLALWQLLGATPNPFHGFLQSQDEHESISTPLDNKFSLIKKSFSRLEIKPRSAWHPAPSRNFPMRSH